MPEVWTFDVAPVFASNTIFIIGVGLFVCILRHASVLCPSLMRLESKVEVFNLVRSPLSRLLFTKSKARFFRQILQNLQPLWYNNEALSLLDSLVLEVLFHEQIDQFIPLLSLLKTRLTFRKLWQCMLDHVKILVLLLLACGFLFSAAFRA